MTRLTRSTDATVYIALDLGVVTAVVVGHGAEWETRCYYGPAEYDAALARNRETAEADALAYAIRLSDRGEEVGPN